nr:uncharacterized protein LOC127310163 [Lolium perenne]
MADTSVGKEDVVTKEATASSVHGDATHADEEERGESLAPEPKEEIESMLKRLEITEEEDDAIDLSGLIENRSAMKWAVIMKCLGDWKTAMHGGPWMFRRNAVVIEEYDGLVNTETIALDSIRVWIRIMGLPELVRNTAAAKAMAGKLGEVLEVDLGLKGAPYVKFVRVYMRIKLKKPLMRFVTGRVDAGKEPQKFRVLYEKMPRFCAHCSVIGHIAEEYGDGAHDPQKFQYGDFMMVPQEEFWYQPKKEFVTRPMSSNFRGRGGRGRGGRSGPAHSNEGMDVDGTNMGTRGGTGDSSWLRKRDMNVRDNIPKNNTLAIMSGSHVANVIGTLEGKATGETTPQKVQPPKRHKGGNTM